MKRLADRLDRQILEQLSDVDIARRVRKGESALFELLMRRYNRRLFRIARGILGNEADAEEIVQEAYVKAYFRLWQFRGEDGFGAWLCKIATHEALMRYRSRPRAAFAPLEVLEDAQNQEAAMADPQSPNINPDIHLHANEMNRLLERAVDALPEAYRTAFVLRELEQLTVAEAAECLNIEEVTVKTRVHRARRMLQRNLTSDLSTALLGVYEFGGERCERLVVQSFAQIAAKTGQL